MIYLDVTSAAVSPMNTGVQRSIRGIYQSLEEDCAQTHTHGVRPMRWDFSGRCYAALSGREGRFLTTPFANYNRAAAWPGFGGWLAGKEAFRDRWTHKRRRMTMDVLLKEEDTLLIPDLCWDTRIHSWERISRLPGKKVAFFHDAMPLRIKGQPLSKDKLFAEYVRKLGFMDRVICVSQEVEQDLLHFWKEYGVVPTRTKVLPWPVQFHGERPRNVPNQASGKLIYVSRLRLRKNHLVLLEACDLLWGKGRTFSLDLIGVADTLVDTHRILSRVRQSASNGRPVRWLRHVSDEGLHEAYRDSAFTLFPSRMEGFGLPILESLWHGRPVICGSNGAIGEVSAGGGCLQVDQNDPVDLARGIQSLLDDKELYNRLHREASTREFHSWADYRGEMLSAIESLVAA
jgi:glycosyltransferase involved in cell wall biosynthesis